MCLFRDSCGGGVIVATRLDLCFCENNKTDKGDLVLGRGGEEFLSEPSMAGGGRKAFGARIIGAVAET